MLTRILHRVFIRAGVYVLHPNYFRSSYRYQNYASDEGHEDPKSIREHKTTMLPGGGLEKMQGSIKEEAYFNTIGHELISQMRKEGATLKCEDCVGNWSEFEKVLATSVPATIRETSLLDKHKNCGEEAYFLEEQNNCVKLLQEKLMPHINDKTMKMHPNTIDNVPKQTDGDAEIPLSNVDNDKFVDEMSTPLLDAAEAEIIVGVDIVAAPDTNETMSIPKEGAEAEPKSSSTIAAEYIPEVNATANETNETIDTTMHSTMKKSLNDLVDTTNNITGDHIISDASDITDDSKTLAMNEKEELKSEVK